MFLFCEFFNNKNKMCMCLNFAAVIKREVGKVKFKFIKKCIVYHCWLAMYAILGVVNAFMHRVSFYKKHEPR